METTDCNLTLLHLIRSSLSSKSSIFEDFFSPFILIIWILDKTVYRYTVRRLPLYCAQNHLIYRYAMRNLPIHSARITGILCALSSL